MFVIENIANFSEIPALASTFAAANGWTVGAATDAAMFPDARTFQRPEGGPTFELRRESQTDGADRLAIFDTAAPTGNRAQIDNIRVGGAVNAPLIPSPTRLFLFTGTEEGHSYICAMIEFGFNRYRAFYLGGAVIKGDYTGGEIVAGNTHLNSGVTFEWPRETDEHRLLFQASGTVFGADEAGFVRVVHPDLANPVLPLASPRSSFQTPDVFIPENRVLCGPYDGVNDTFVRDGQEHFAAATLLTPHNLYQTTGAPIRLRPLGHVAGTRMVNMTNLEPGQQVTVGAVNWRVFPEFRKSDVTEINQGDPLATGSFNTDESSEFWGLAFPENLAT